MGRFQGTNRLHRPVPVPRSPLGQAKKPISSGKRRWLIREGGGTWLHGRLKVDVQARSLVINSTPGGPGTRRPDQIPVKDKHQRAFVWTRRRTTGNPTYARHIHRSGAVRTTQESGYRRGWLWRTWSRRTLNHVASSRLPHATPQAADMLSLVPTRFLDAG